MAAVLRELMAFSPAAERAAAAWWNRSHVSSSEEETRIADRATGEQTLSLRNAGRVHMSYFATAVLVHPSSCCYVWHFLVAADRKGPGGDMQGGRRAVFAARSRSGMPSLDRPHWSHPAERKALPVGTFCTWIPEAAEEDFRRKHGRAASQFEQYLQ